MARVVTGARRKRCAHSGGASCNRCAKKSSCGLTSILKPWPGPCLTCWHWASGGAVRGSNARWGSSAARSGYRQPQSLEPPATQGVPPEVLPLVTALNDVCERTAQLLATEQQFTADAAELRTPIAGIRIKPQVAQGRGRFAGTRTRWRPPCKAATATPGGTGCATGAAGCRTNTVTPRTPLAA